ncbi:hypothetical protein [Alishewanella sp. SMS8]|uniref:hypothetical protein n=1 Tax=Alishewanella sp. SMS8 TaxID=2994676 RepID=UPI002740EC86|nr:hypothetical protein [Alishewanella sp. SMS8]MDP5460015.1 hypothetical protein [Alishewanella sp. SMS8]
MRPPSHRVRSKAQQQSDWQLLQLHARIADKLLANPQLAIPLLEKLELRYQTGLIKHWGYIRWHSILTMMHEPEIFKQALLEDSDSMRRLRRKTLLTGILTEQERDSLLLEQQTETD